ncbi:MAG: hypothetical protein QOE36_2611 [Gaiellaceae bacterium]|nr:hypothetical protein [Gaiellaceae bacterium]
MATFADCARGKNGAVQRALLVVLALAVGGAFAAAAPATKPKQPRILPGQQDLLLAAPHSNTVRCTGEDGSLTCSLRNASGDPAPGYSVQLTQDRLVVSQFTTASGNPTTVPVLQRRQPGNGVQFGAYTQDAQAPKLRIKPGLRVAFAGTSILCNARKQSGQTLLACFLVGPAPTWKILRSSSGFQVTATKIRVVDVAANGKTAVARTFVHGH